MSFWLELSGPPPPPPPPPPPHSLPHDNPCLGLTGGLRCWILLNFSKKDTTPQCSRVVPHPSTDRGPSCVNFGVRMGSGVLQLVWSYPSVSGGYLALYFQPKPPGGLAGPAGRVHSEASFSLNFDFFYVLLKRFALLPF